MNWLSVNSAYAFIYTKIDLINARFNFSVCVYVWERNRNREEPAEAVKHVGQIFNPWRHSELFSVSLSDWPGNFMNPFSQGGLAAKMYWKCQIQISLTLTVIKEITSMSLSECAFRYSCTQEPSCLRKRIILHFLEYMEKRLKIINNFLKC